VVFGDLQVHPRIMTNHAFNDDGRRIDVNMLRCEYSSTSMSPNRSAAARRALVGAVRCGP
jgi:hypothetical protein